MFSDDFLEWIFARNEMQKLTFAEQSQFVHALDSKRLQVWRKVSIQRRQNLENYQS